MGLIEKFHTGPSFAVKFYPKLNHIWTAQGPFLKIYHKESGELIHLCKIFSRNKVHGISFNNDSNALFYGSTSYTFVSVEELYNSNDISSMEQKDPEWITSGEISDSNQVYLLTCYNKVMIFDFSSKTHLATKALFQERSILYSGSIKLKSETEIIVCAGTVMGGVLVWECNEEKLLHNLKGHEGSIFNTVCNEQATRVASCSDDRTIRIWDIETGKELCMAFGHTARIWSLKFINNDTQVVSTSEDCTMRVWNIVEDDGSVDNFSLEQSSVHEVHQIKNVWACDVLDNLIVTTGNDGRVNITDVNDIGEIGRNISTFSLDEILKETNKSMLKKEIFKSFHKFNFGVVVMTSEGRCFQHLSKTGEWTLLFEDNTFFSYNSIYGFENICVFTNSSGSIKIIKFADDGSILQSWDKSIKDKVTKVVNTLAVLFQNYICVLLESPNPTNPMVLLKINVTDINDMLIIEFNKPKNFSTSSMEVYEDLLLVGSRMSTLGIFKISDSTGEPVVLRTLTPGDNTTSITFSKKFYNSNPIFSITNRDGFYNFISVDQITLNYKILHSNKIAKGFLQQGSFNEEDDFIITGFKSNIFHISNESKNFEIRSEVCGGAHRQWKLFNKNETTGEQTLAYARGSLYLREFSDYLQKPQVLSAGMHGREIRDIAIQPGQENSKDILFVTGSEDTTIKVCSFNKDSGKITQYWTQRKHVSGLQRVKFINSKYLVSCCAREELFLWELSRSDDGYPFLNLVKAVPTISDNPDLRIMDFDFIFNGEKEDEFMITTVYSDSSIRLWYYNNEQKFTLVLSGKYETCCLFNIAFETVGEKLLLLVTPTDGHIVYWDITEYIPFHIKNGKLYDLNEAGFTFKENTQQLPAYVNRFVVHKSGTKTIDIFRNGDDAFCVLTGGDDNGLGISQFKIDSSGAIQAECIQIVDSAAASTITSVNYFTKDNNRYCLVGAVDQDLRVWQITENLELTLEEEKFTTVADTNSLDIYDSSIAVVGGVGCSIWSL